MKALTKFANSSINIPFPEYEKLHEEKMNKDLKRSVVVPSALAVGLLSVPNGNRHLYVSGGKKLGAVLLGLHAANNAKLKYDANNYMNSGKKDRRKLATVAAMDENHNPVVSIAGGIGLARLFGRVGDASIKGLSGNDDDIRRVSDSL